MSQATVELVRRHYAQIQQYLRNPASDFDRRLAEFLDDLAEPRYGHAGVRQYVEMLFEAIEDYRMDPEEFIDATAHLWTIRDGKAVRMQS